MKTKKWDNMCELNVLTEIKTAESVDYLHWLYQTYPRTCEHFQSQWEEKYHEICDQEIAAFEGVYFT